MELWVGQMLCQACRRKQDMGNVCWATSVPAEVLFWRCFPFQAYNLKFSKGKKHQSIEETSRSVNHNISAYDLLHRSLA